MNGIGKIVVGTILAAVATLAGMEGKTLLANGYKEFKTAFAKM